MTKKFLHVGCGRLTKANSTPEFQKKEWIETRLDIDESVTPDIISSITDMSVVDSDSFDAVYSSHNIDGSVMSIKKRSSCNNSNFIFRSISFQFIIVV